MEGDPDRAVDRGELVTLQERAPENFEKFLH
jgi:hypothetical protein